MLWVKAFHIIFMVTWFAGLFYLPRLYVYHAQCDDEQGYERFCVMEKKLFIMMTHWGGVDYFFWVVAIYGVWFFRGLVACKTSVGFGIGGLPPVLSED